LPQANLISKLQQNSIHPWLQPIITVALPKTGEATILNKGNRNGWMVAGKQ
jgi:hypothetical protein